MTELNRIHQKSSTEDTELTTFEFVSRAKQNFLILTVVIHGHRKPPDLPVPTTDNL